MTEPIDAAHQVFKKLSAEVSQYIHVLTTEADVRLKVIDRMFTEVLGWPYGDILAEPATPSGFADYAFRHEGRSRLIVEAKRDGLSLGCEMRTAERGYKLNGPTFKSPTAKEGINQAIRYCGEKNAELACVTNGREWIVFRGNRLGDGVDTREGVAFVYPNWAVLEESFAHFYNLLSAESCRNNTFRPVFRAAEGLPIRMSVFQRSVRPQGSARYVSASELGADIDKMMSSFFKRLTGDEDPELLRYCFVETAESRHAEGQLARITDSLATRIKDLHTGTAEELTKLLQRTTETRRHEFVVLVGTKGAGKSTFINRFFEMVLSEKVAQGCTILDIDMAEYPGDIDSAVDWVDRALLLEAERMIFKGDAPTLNELTGVFYDEYTRLKKGPWARLYESDYDAFMIKFGEWLETRREAHPHEYLQGLVRHVVTNRIKVPVIVFDNTDHFSIDFQQVIYQYARSLYEKVVCLVILPITDRTSWQLSKHGALQSFDHESFFLPSPPTKSIIQKRIEFIEGKLDNLRAKPDDRYFVTRGISLSLTNLSAFTKALQQIFLQTSSTSDWIGELANYDVRRTLTLAGQFIASPHLMVEDLLHAYIAGSAIDLPAWKAQRALLLGHYDIYPVAQHDFVQNLYSLSTEVETTPLLGARLLQAMADVPRDEHEGALIDVEKLIGFGQMMDVDERTCRMWIDAMLKTGLCVNYDPTVLDDDRATRLELTPSGRLHLNWSRGSYEYICAMALVTPLLDEGVHYALQDAYSTREWRQVASRFTQYLVAEDKMHCRLPDHSAYAGQRRMLAHLEQLADNWSRPRPVVTHRTSGSVDQTRRSHVSRTD